MVRIILSGCNGKMGKVITKLVSQRKDCEIVAGIAISGENCLDFPVFSSAKDINCGADVIIDFSNPKALSSLLEYSKQKHYPIILCTTGFSKTQVLEIEAAAKETPIFYSGNMSLGINLLIELSKKAVELLGGDFDVEIVEKHHNQKIDAPSGTALMIADAVSSAMEKEPNYVYDRHAYRKPRSKNEIGIHSVRGGSIVGEHEIIFAGHDELLTISHSAQSKEIFANGAINAAVFMVGKGAGLYNMANLISQN